jgi:hypothetical protein
MKRILRMKRVLVAITAVAASVVTVAVITAAGFGPINHVDNRFDAWLSSAQEVAGSPPVPVAFVSPMSGKFKMKFRGDLSEARWTLAVDNNVGSITAAHIHCGVAGVNGGVFIPLFGGTPFTAPSGILASGTVTNAAFASPLMCQGMTINNVVTLMVAMEEGVFYVNVHTVANGGGEVRGQLFGN